MDRSFNLLIALEAVEDETKFAFVNIYAPNKARVKIF